MRKLLKYFFIFVLLIALSIGVGSYVFLKNITNASIVPKDNNSDVGKFNIGNNNQNKGTLNMIILGVDHASPNDVGRSDTLMYLTYNPKTRKATLISIPRDTRIMLDKYGYQKINAAYAFYGPEKSAEEVSKILNMPVDYYFKVDFNAFQELIDALGGIDFRVPVNLDHDNMHFKKGQIQHLNGAEALYLMRWRHSYVDQDLGRIKTQQAFLRTLFDKVASPSSIFKSKAILTIMSKYVKTNMPPMTMLSYIDDIFKVDKNITMETLPGEPKYINGISYYIYDPQKTQEMMAKVNHDEGYVQAESNAVTSFNPSDIKVEVLNGSGITGAAAKVAGILRQQNYNVVNIANADRMDYSTTQIINRTSNSGVADSIKALFNNSNVINESSTSGKSDVTVIVGSDFSN